MNGNYQIGDVVFGNWVIREKIGEGSFGKVYGIERQDFGRTYTAALKVITVPQNDAELKIAMDEGMDYEELSQHFYAVVEDIVQEFYLMSQVKGSGHVVGYEDHTVIPHEGKIGWDILIRMERLTPLLTWAYDHPMSRKDIIRLGIHLCKALEVCQAQHILHRDIKPENIFVSPTGDFKLGDFGIARTVEKTMSGMSKKGTYNYMAPEVYKGQEYGFKADIYSVGIVLYRLLNRNRFPFLPPAPHQIGMKDRDQALARRMSGESMPLPYYALGELGRIVCKAAAYQPANRYSSPAQMRKELEDVLLQERYDTLIYPDAEDLRKRRQVDQMSRTNEPSVTPRMTDQTKASGQNDWLVAEDGTERTSSGISRTGNRQPVEQEDATEKTVSAWSANTPSKQKPTMQEKVKAAADEAFGSADKVSKSVQKGTKKQPQKKQPQKKVSATKKTSEKAPEKTSKKIGIAFLGIAAALFLIIIISAAVRSKREADAMRELNEWATQIAWDDFANEKWQVFYHSLDVDDEYQLDYRTSSVETIAEAWQAAGLVFRDKSANLMEGIYIQEEDFGRVIHAGTEDYALFIYFSELTGTKKRTITIKGDAGEIYAAQSAGEIPMILPTEYVLQTTTTEDLDISSDMIQWMEEYEGREYTYIYNWNVRGFGEGCDSGFLVKMNRYGTEYYLVLEFKKVDGTYLLDSVELQFPPETEYTEEENAELEEQWHTWVNTTWDEMYAAMDMGTIDYRNDSLQDIGVYLVENGFKCYENGKPATGATVWELDGVTYLQTVHSAGLSLIVADKEGEETHSRSISYGWNSEEYPWFDDLLFAEVKQPVISEKYIPQHTTVGEIGILSTMMDWILREPEFAQDWQWEVHVDEFYGHGQENFTMEISHKEDGRYMSLTFGLCPDGWRVDSIQMEFSVE